MIKYHIDLTQRNEHLYRVTMSSIVPSEAIQLQMPTWIAGSYLIRDMAGDVTTVDARQGSRVVPVQKTDKTTWQIQADPLGEMLIVQYEVYAYDLSVRLAYLDTERGFFNPGSLCMKQLGEENQACYIDIKEPTDTTHPWRCLSSLQPVSTNPMGWGCYKARDYEELIDSPFEMGNVRVLTFQAHAREHRIVISGVSVQFAHERLTQDVKRLCETVMKFFDPTLQRIPFENYTFFLHISAGGYGGLEHRRSAALIADVDDLPYDRDGDADEAYLQLLTLFTHEYFHAWWVKWVKPKAFTRMDDQKETYTRQLWIFEGFTSYYDELLTYRAGLMSKKAYACALSKMLNAHTGVPAYRHQTLSQSSFDAWIKFYKPNANRCNAVVSYYVGGALLAMVLDATIQQRTQGRYRLDDVLRLAVQEAEQAGTEYQGLGEAALAGLIQRACSVDLSQEIECYANTCELPDYEAALNVLGFECVKKAHSNVQSRMGLKLQQDKNGVMVLQVLSGSPAAKAGLAGQDWIIAVDQVKTNLERLKRCLDRWPSGRELTIHYFRANVLCKTTLKLADSVNDGYEVCARVD